MQSADLMEISLPSDQHDFVRAGWIRFTDREWNLLCKGHRVLLPKQIFPGFCSSAIALSRATRDIDNAGASILKYAKTSSAKPTYRSRPVEGRGNSHHISDSTGFSTHHLGKKNQSVGEKTQSQIPLGRNFCSLLLWVNQNKHDGFVIIAAHEF